MHGAEWPCLSFRVSLSSEKKFPDAWIIFLLLISKILKQVTVCSPITTEPIDIFFLIWGKNGWFSNQTNNLELSAAYLFIRDLRKSSCCSLEEITKQQNTSSDIQIWKVVVATRDHLLKTLSHISLPVWVL